jgi:hypothetical protein
MECSHDKVVRFFMTQTEIPEENVVCTNCIIFDDFLLPFVQNDEKSVEGTKCLRDLQSITKWYSILKS